MKTLKTLCLTFFFLSQGQFCECQFVKVNRDSILSEYNAAKETKSKKEAILIFYRQFAVDSSDTYFLADLLERLGDSTVEGKSAVITGQRMKARSLSSAGNKRAAIELRKKAILNLNELLHEIDEEHPEYKNLKRSLAATHMNLGSVHTTLFEQAKAIFHLEEGLTVSKEINDLPFIQKTLTLLSNVYYSIADYKTATEYLFEALELSENNESVYTIETFNSLGLNYKKIGDMERALKYYKQAYALANNIEHKVIENYKILSLSSIHGYYSELNQENKTDSILQELKILSEANKTFYHLTYDYLSEAQMHITLGQLTKAKFYLEQAEPMIKKDNNDMTANYLLTKSKLLKAQGNYKDAKANALNALELTNQTNRLTNKLSIYKLLADIEFENGKYKNAVHYHKSYNTLNDSIYDSKLILNQEVQSQKYESAKKENEIASLKMSQIEDNARINRQKILLISFILGTGLLCLLLFSFYSNNKKTKNNNKILSEKNQIIQTKNQQNQTLLKEIHHRVKNNLQTISSLLYLQSSTISDEDAKEAITQGQHRVESMALIHKNLYQGQNLAAIEMKDYISRLIKNLEDAYLNSGQSITIDLNMEETEVDVDRAIPLGLIINELLTNVFKYAFPENKNGHVSIFFRSDEKKDFHLKIKDDGIGNNKEREGFGTQLIQLLVKQLDAKFSDGNDNGYWFEITA